MEIFISLEKDFLSRKFSLPEFRRLLLEKKEILNNVNTYFHDRELEQIRANLLEKLEEVEELLNKHSIDVRSKSTGYVRAYIMSEKYAINKINAARKVIEKNKERIANRWKKIESSVSF